ncbi:MAG: cytochrome c oxidase subunit II [Verrucomicrobiota bacterium JB023]|nr:cytochrome c oxidase subunit II [Verrucomicrobiota bacterium JB023]
MTPTKLLGIPESFSDHGGGVDHMIDVVHYFMLALFVGWTLFFLYCLWRFAARRNPKANYAGVTNHVSTHLEIGVVLIEAVLLLGFAFPLWYDRTDEFEIVQKQDPNRVRVIGYQFGWNYHYPGADGKFGRIDRQLTAGVGDPAIDPDDPNGWDDFLSPSLKVPVDKPSILQITATDVIHNYSIIPMRIQQDAIPGSDIPMWFTPIKTLETYVVCGQLCGDQHGNMKGLMEVVKQSSFDTWAEEQSAASLKRNQERQQQQPAVAVN